MNIKQRSDRRRGSWKMGENKETFLARTLGASTTRSHRPAVATAAARVTVRRGQARYGHGGTVARLVGCYVTAARPDSSRRRWCGRVDRFPAGFPPTDAAPSRDLLAIRSRWCRRIFYRTVAEPRPPLVKNVEIFLRPIFLDPLREKSSCFLKYLVRTLEKIQRNIQLKR